MPFREVLVPYEQQPQEYAEIDWGNSLTDKLLYVGYGDMGGINFVNGQVGTDNNGVTNRTTIGGQGWVNPDGASRYRNYNITPIAVPTNKITLAGILIPSSLVEQVVICLHLASGSARAQLQLTSSGYVQVFTNTGSFGSSAQPLINESSVIAGTIGMGDTNGTILYLNGSKVATGTLSAGSATYNTVTIGSRFNSGYGLFMRGGSPLQVAWGRALSEDEHASFAKNPWQLFKPKTIYVPVASTGGVSLLPSGIPSSETFGTSAITRGDVSILTTGIVSAESFGTHVIGVAGGPQILSPTGIASAMAFGSPQIALGSSGIVVPGVGSGEAFGTPTIGRGLITVIPSGIASAQMFGTPGVLKGTLVIYPGGIPSGESFGIPALVGGTSVETQAVFYVRGFSAFGSRRNS